MPNWCMNQATLKHSDPQMLERVVTSTETSNLFSEFHPIPKEEKENWYEWCTTNWGTKWDISGGYTEEGEDGLNLTFDTAWGPPLAFYQFLEELGFEVEASYYEPGIGFCGLWEGGNNDHYDSIYDYTSEDVRDYIGEYLDDQWNISGEMADREADEDYDDDEDSEDEDA